MKDTHLIIALYRALDRYGTSTRPEGGSPASCRTARPAPHHDRRRSPGWVTAAEVEASQSPNTFPKLTQRTIALRCDAMAAREGSPVLRVERGDVGSEAWILVAPPGEDPASRGIDADPKPGPGDRDP